MNDMRPLDAGTLYLGIFDVVKYKILRTDSADQPTLLVFDNGEDLRVIFDSEGEVLGAMDGAGQYAGALEQTLRSTYTGSLYNAMSKWELYSPLIRGFFDERD